MSRPTSRSYEVWESGFGYWSLAPRYALLTTTVGYNCGNQDHVAQDRRFLIWVLVGWTLAFRSTWGLNDANCWSQVSTQNFHKTWMNYFTDTQCLCVTACVLYSNADPQRLASIPSSMAPSTQQDAQPSVGSTQILKEGRASVPTVNCLTSPVKGFVFQMSREEANFGTTL